MTKSRKEKFEKWKAEKLTKSAKDRESSSEEDTGGSDINKETSDGVISDEANRDVVFDRSHAGGHRSSSPSKSPYSSTSRKRHASMCSRSSFSSVSSRHSFHGFRSIPSHLKQQSLERSHDQLMVTPVKRQHTSSPGFATISSSPVRSPVSGFTSPTSSQKKNTRDALLSSSPVTLFSPELLNKKSAQLLRKGTPSRKKPKRPQFPGFL